MKRTTKNCYRCNHRRLNHISDSLTFLGSFIIALLPKCPFCVLAYSSAISMCGSTSGFTPTWSSWLSVGLALLTLIMILLNYRGTRTLVSAGLVVLGSAMIIEAELFTGELFIYYFGALILMFGVWINGSFLYFLGRWMRKSGVIEAASARKSTFLTTSNNYLTKYFQNDTSTI